MEQTQGHGTRASVMIVPQATQARRNETHQTH
jgi:hypothetical protein